jgi:hypothetical protein
MSSHTLILCKIIFLKIHKLHVNYVTPIVCESSYKKEYFCGIPSLRTGSWREEGDQNLELIYGTMEIWGIGNGPVELELECAGDF